ncbi:MAG: MFS transporter [Acidimicrobiia bacterium]
MTAPETRSRLGTGYAKLWTASVVSNLGDGVATVAWPWLASAVTRDPVLLSLTIVANRLPWLLFSLPAGVLTDRLDRRRTMVWMDVVRAVLVAGVAWAIGVGADSLSDPALVGDETFLPPPGQGWWLALLYGSALAVGAAEVLRDNAAQTIMPRLVPASLLERANGRLWGAEMVMNSFAGPPLGGWLVALAFAAPFWFDAGTFALAAVLVASIGGTFGPAERTGPPPARRFWGELRDGFRWLWQHRLLRTLAIVLGILNAALALSFATLVLFAQEVLALDATLFGTLLTAGAAGGVVGSFAAARISKALGPGTSLTIVMVGGIGAMAGIGLTSNWLVVWAMFFASSLLGVLWNVITVSLRQEIIPDALLGRVNSVYRFFGWGMMPLGSLTGGAIVAVVEPVAGREWALRAPFLFAAGLFVAMTVVAAPRLTTARIEAARAGHGT